MSFPMKISPLRLQISRWVLSYFGMVGRLRSDDHDLWDFQSNWVPILYLNMIQLTTSFCRKNQFVSITFSCRDTRTKSWSNVSPKCIILTDFKHFVSIFSLFFLFNWPPFSLILNLFDPSFSQTVSSDWVQFFFACWTWLPEIWWSTHPPLQYTLIIHTYVI